MQRLWTAGMAALAGIVLLGSAAPAKAVAIRIAPGHERVAQADCIIVGKVTSIAPKTVAARTAPQVDQRTEYTVASVKIKDALLGAKGLTDIRVAFIAPVRPNLPPQADGGKPLARPLPIRRPFIQPNLTAGQEALLFLNKHFEEDFYVFAGFQGVVNKQNNPNFDKELKQVKNYVSLLEHPKKGLKAKEDQERLMTAGLLISRYRAYKVGMKSPPATQPVSAEESRLILAVLANADWTKQQQFGQVHPVQLFYQLGLSAKDGWTQPRFDPAKGNNFNEQLSAAAKEWIKKNKDYRIQRFVMEKADRK